MSLPLPSPSDDIDQIATDWALRRDRGLTAAEQDELSHWLAEDTRHGDALATARWGWEELDRLTGLQTSLNAVADPDLLAPARARAKSPRWNRPLVWVPASLAAAAAIAGGFFLRDSAPAPTSTLATAGANAAATPALTVPCEQRTLDDGSVVELNRGAQIEVTFTPAERRVALVHGEAHFTVAKNPARPFIVSAGEFEVRAVGTAFNVELHPAGADVVVTEGQVSLRQKPSRGHPTATTTDALALLSAGQLAALRRTTTPKIDTLTPAQVEARLAWQPRMFDFTDAPLADILAKFNRRNPVQLRAADAQLAALRLSATFRSDNVEGFVQLMESDFGMRAERRSATEIVLSRAR